ncbi:hypothetical protein J2W53_005951 [Pseudomonas frederiksbergensis]|jgi:hypothetical protein|nr:hypothetical protein [Pseudomonas frederiksbergensis]
MLTREEVRNLSCVAAYVCALGVFQVGSEAVPDPDAQVQLSHVYLLRFLLVD